MRAANIADEKSHKLLDLFLHDGHSFRLRALELVGGAAKVTQHIMTLVMQEDVLHLKTHKRGGSSRGHERRKGLCRKGTPQRPPERRRHGSGFILLNTNTKAEATSKCSGEIRPPQTYQACFF